MSKGIHLVIIEDNEADQLAYERFIRKGIASDIAISVFDTGEEALQYLDKNEADCVLLDYKLPDMTGLEILEALISVDRPTPPVVMLTGMGNENIAVQALKLGAYDYLSKSELQEAVLIKAITNASEKSSLSKNINIKDKEISKMAEFDLLTGLPNRLKFEAILNRTIDSNLGNKIAIFMIDIDRFKNINDSKGHEYGDLFLKQVGLKLKKCLPKDALLARFGGDEFAILALLEKEDDGAELADLILSELSKPVVADDGTSASIGIAIFPDAGRSVTELLKNADVALFSAKNSGKNTFKYFSEEMTDVLTERLQIEHELRFALSNKEFFLVFHPICNIQDQNIFALEVLVRWKNKKLGIVPPDLFIPIAEDTGVINDLGEWILATALEQLSQWQKNFNQHLKFTMNISPMQVKQAHWVDTFAAQFKKYHISPESVIIELTETAIISDLGHVKEVLLQFSNMGCPIFLDDFGTGYSSLNLVRQLPISGLKIDKTYVQDLDQDEGDAKLVKSIFAFAEVLDLLVVAEGVEKEVQLDYLAKIASKQLAQGYFLSLPLSASDMEKLLTKKYGSKPDALK